MKKYFMIAAAMLAMASCGNKNKEAETVAEELPEVKLATVHSDVLPQTETYTAVVESDVKNNISPNVAYRIEKVLVDVGDRVKKGQVVVQLDASSLRQLKLQIDNQKLEFSRTEQLYNVGGASKTEYDNAKMQLDVLQTQYAQMSRNTQLYAPISGVVTARNYDNGDMYNGTPILTIEETSVVKIVTNISEIHYKDIKKGQAIDIELDAYPGEKFVGHVSIIHPSIDEATHTFPVEITISNKNQKVRPGMFARATVNFGSQEHVLIPDEALVKQIGAGDRYVYVYDAAKQTVTYNKVELGKHIGKTYEIFSGVKDGQQVVVAGQSRLANGKKVKVVK